MSSDFRSKAFRGSTSSKGAYIRVAALKKLVVGFQSRKVNSPKGCTLIFLRLRRKLVLHLTVWYGVLTFYLEESRVFQAGYPA